MLFHLTLTPCREDQDRYWSLISYERQGPVVVPLRKEYRWVDTGRGWRFTCVRVSKVRRVPDLRGREWPRNLAPAPESEELRRERIRVARRRCHLESAKGQQEPNWYPLTNGPEVSINGVQQ